MSNPASQVVAQRPVPEHIASGLADPAQSLLPAIELREFVSRRFGANGISTGTATFEPGAVLPYHTHPFSEAITILEGRALVSVQGRTYRMHPLDCIHVPAGIAHRVACASNTRRLKAHWAFAADQPDRDFVEDTFEPIDRSDAEASGGDPEHIMRFSSLVPYELAGGTRFYDLFAGRFGSEGICGGYGEFDAGAGLPCHTHNYDESITIVKGQAYCYVAGRKYLLSNCDTALVPQGNPHRFVNAASDAMAMIWVYAGSEPQRALVDTRYCDGGLVWPE